MSVRSFFDTNVLVYTDDADAPEKRARVMALWEAHRLSFWDAMIVHMADRAGCAVLFSEDLQSGSRILGLEIIDPFSD
jgi:predicted nucleic acid-binding protein